MVLRLRRNVGHQKAIAIGLGYVEENLPDAQRVVVMDSDGEDLPEIIATLLEAVRDENVDVAVARRRSRWKHCASARFTWCTNSSSSC